MIVIDTSAVMAVLRDEPERRTFTEAIEHAERCFISAVSFVEASMVIEARSGYEGLRDFDLFILKAGIEVMAVDAEQAKIARATFRKFGKGRHAANLNFGDCFSYALAKALEAPLLFKGNDFSRTDVEAVVIRTIKNLIPAEQGAVCNPSDAERRTARNLKSCAAFQPEIERLADIANEKTGCERKAVTTTPRTARNGFIPFSSGLGSDPGARQAPPVKVGEDSTDGTVVLLRAGHAPMACGSNRVGGRKQKPTEATQGDALPPPSAVGIFGLQAGENVKQKSHLMRTKEQAGYRMALIDDWLAFPSVA